MPPGGDFFAEEYNVILFVCVLGVLTSMMSGCYIYHKCQSIRARKNPELIVAPSKKRKKKDKGFATDLRQLEIEAERNMKQPIEESSGGLGVSNPAYHQGGDSEADGDTRDEGDLQQPSDSVYERG